MLIEAEDLQKSFGSVEAVRGISFRVARGERVGILGANGAGKSTTLRMLAGTLAPDSGTARIASADVLGDPLTARSAIGYLPEAANGFGRLTVAEFLLFAAEARGIPPGARKESAARVIDALDLGSALSRSLATLSKGWRQRAWLAQALIHDPQVLILDEPTDGLDPNQKIALRELLGTLTRDKAMLISTHILEEAEALCDRLIVIDNGLVVADAMTKELVDGSGRLAPAFTRLTGGGARDARDRVAT
ncbi:MAG: ABC transporter ATP-binding protein [Hyphomicrobiaceae bacterium]|nr:ABC transporter ATP-binding protein [Hyphomicrobiaceae bacterium]